MSQNENQKHPMTDILEGVRKEMNRLATDDVSSVIDGMHDFVSEKISSDPYGTLITALGIGYGLSALNRSHMKTAAIRIGKLVVMKAVSNLEESQQMESSNNHVEASRKQISA
jgi:hypothetical protein